MRCEAGAAVFVKTPGLSPLKTRLARAIGSQEAENFYRLSCLILEELLLSVPQLQGYWALAESRTEARDYPLWAGLPHLAQGEGQLGERLDCVYRQLLQQHPVAILLGADTPQLPKAYIEMAIESRRAGEFIVGPADDGGFYLFAGSTSLPSEAWTSVRYSQADTLEQLLQALGQQKPIRFLPRLHDVDEGNDLAPALAFLRQQEPLAGRSLDLLAWYRRLEGEKSRIQPI